MPRRCPSTASLWFGCWDKSRVPEVSAWIATDLQFPVVSSPLRTGRVLLGPAPTKISWKPRINLEPPGDSGPLARQWVQATSVAEEWELLALEQDASLEPNRSLMPHEPMGLLSWTHPAPSCRHQGSNQGHTSTSAMYN